MKRYETWGMTGRQATKVQKWRAWVNCSRYEQRQPERLGPRRWILDSRVRPTISDEVLLIGLNGTVCHCQFAVLTRVVLTCYFKWQLNVVRVETFRCSLYMSKFVILQETWHLACAARLIIGRRVSGVIETHHTQSTRLFSSSSLRAVSLRSAGAPRQNTMMIDSCNVISVLRGI